MAVTRCNGICILGHEVIEGGGSLVVAAHPGCLLHSPETAALRDPDATAERVRCACPLCNPPTEET